MSQSTKHTPGPWAIEAYDTGAGIIAVNDDKCVAIVADQDMDLELDLANARLLAAAPELLEALEYLYRIVMQIPDDNWHRLVRYDGEYAEISPIDMAKEAIKKARGES